MYGVRIVKNPRSIRRSLLCGTASHPSEKSLWEPKPTSADIAENVEVNPQPNLRAIGVLQFENLSLGRREPTPGFSCTVGGWVGRITSYKDSDLLVHQTSARVAGRIGSGSRNPGTGT